MAFHLLSPVCLSVINYFRGGLVMGRSEKMSWKSHGILFSKFCVNPVGPLQYKAVRVTRLK